MKPSDKILKILKENPFKDNFNETTLVETVYTSRQNERLLNALIQYLDEEYESINTK